MYQVTILNDKKETVINAVSTDKDAPRVTGNIKQGINSFDSFTFTIYSNNPGYSKINPFKTLVKVLNTKTKKYEFIGRVLSPSEELQESGLFFISYVCESALAYLVDSIQRYESFTNISVKDYLGKLLDNHNNKMEEDFKKIYLGKVEIDEKSDFVNAYETTYDNINTKLLNTFGGELSLRHEDKIYLDYLKQTGRKSKTKIMLKKNLKSMSRKLNIDDFGTRFIFTGAKIKSKDNDGNETDTEECITISKLNNGYDYLDYKDGVEKFGIIEKTVNFDDAEDAETLLKKAKEYINSISIPTSLSLDAVDLYYLGIDFDSFEVGNYYPVCIEIFSIDYDARVIEKNIVIEDPSSNTLTFDDKELDIKTYSANKNKNIFNDVESTSKNIIEIKQKVIRLETQVISTEKQIQKTEKQVQKIEENSGSYVDVNTYNKNLKETNENFTKLQKQIDELKGGSNA
ncbi:phage tail protein [Intestinibacter bartlettii]|uniref:phage tail protein n=1 Tax=Intestinibacter bartlettii TaxID=261299 RepID=UPI0039938B3E